MPVFVQRFIRMSLMSQNKQLRKGIVKPFNGWSARPGHARHVKKQKFR